jgi:hypothetical protein
VHSPSALGLSNAIVLAQELLDFWVKIDPVTAHDCYVAFSWPPESQWPYPDLPPEN